MTTPKDPKALMDREAREERTLRVVRRIGYVVLFGTALALFAPLIIGVGVGIKKDQMWDPFTGYAVSRADSSVSCLDEAQQIVDTAIGAFAESNEGAERSKWEQRFSLWNARCRREHGDLYDILRSRGGGMREDGRHKSLQK